MCGLIGYIGNNNCIDMIISGLYKLEYRGYDSAGISYYNERKNTISTYKSLGYVKNLEDLINNNDISYKNKNNSINIGIGHTRWATHGKVILKNTHPHLSYDNKISIVHNGVIENYKDAKLKIEMLGFKCISDTDSEIIAHFINHYYNISGSIESAISNVVTEIKGTYGILVYSIHEKDKIYGISNSSPIIIGRNDQHTIISSDCNSIVGYVDKVFYLESGEILVASKNETKIQAINNKKVILKSQYKINVTPDDISKKDFKHYMLKEIYDHTFSIGNTIRGRIDDINSNAVFSCFKDIALNNINKIVIIGMGSSFYSGLVGKDIIEKLSGISVDVLYSSDILSKSYILNSNTLVIAISQSGETADTINAIKEIKIKNIKTIAICNVIGSTISRLSTSGIYLYAGSEISVASTKSFTSQVLILHLIAIKIGRSKTLTIYEGSKLIKNIRKLQSNIKDILNTDMSLYFKINKLVLKYIKYNNIIYMGTYISHSISLEAALKLKEIAYLYSEGFNTSNFKHGPIACINDKSLVIMLLYNKDNSSISTIQSIKSRKGKIIVITQDKDTDISSIVDDIIYLPDIGEYTTPLLYNIVCQIIAYCFGCTIKNNNVDKPKNLAKSITVI